MQALDVYFCLTLPTAPLTIQVPPTRSGGEHQAICDIGRRLSNLVGRWDPMPTETAIIESVVCFAPRCVGAFILFASNRFLEGTSVPGGPGE